jgi:hypothetical protein
MSTPAIDYTALAKQAGAVSSKPAGAVDYAALAKQAGAVSSTSDTPGPLHRFLSSVVDSLNPIPALKEYIDRPGQIGAMMEALKVGSQAHKEGRNLTPEEEKIMERGMNANVSNPVAYTPPAYTEPIIAAAGQAKQGDVAGAAGTLLGSYAVAPAIGAGVSKLASKGSVTARVIPKSSITPEVQAAVGAGVEAGVPVPASVATGNKFVSMAQRAGEHTPVGSIIGEGARREIADSMTSWGKKIAADVSPDMAVPETAANAVRGDVESVISNLRKDADQSYGNFRGAANDPKHLTPVQTGTKQVTSSVLDAQGNPITSEVPITQHVQVPVNVGAFKPAAAAKLEEMSWMPAAERSSNAGYAALKKIVEGPDVIPATSAEMGLSGLKALAREADSPDLRNTSQGIGANLAGDLQGAIDSAVKKADPAMLKDLQAGRATHAAKMEAAGVLKKLRDEPVQLFNQATFAGDAGIQQLRNVAKLAPEAMPKLGRAYVEKLLDTATTEGGFDKGRTLFSQWEKLGPETKKVLFTTPAQIKEMDNFFLLAKKLGEEANPSMTAMVSHGMGQGVLILHNPMLGIPYAIGSAAVTKLLYSPAGVRLLTQGMKIPISNKGATAAGTMIFNQIMKRVGKDAVPLDQTGQTSDPSTQNGPSVPVGAQQ